MVLKKIKNNFIISFLVLDKKKLVPYKIRNGTQVTKMVRGVTKMVTNVTKMVLIQKMKLQKWYQINLIFIKY